MSETHMSKMIESSALKSMDAVTHGFFTRQGGVSSGIFESLNCGFGSSDEASNVAENRARIAAMLGIAPSHLITPYQEHTDTAVIATAPWERKDAPVADAVVTNTPGLAVAVLTADCVPVLFADPEARVVGAAHAGWRGAKKGIIESTLREMERLGAAKERITAAIGPALSQDAYEVGFDFRDNFLGESLENARFFEEAGTSRPHFNLVGYVRMKITKMGIMTVDDLRLCTYDRESLFYSYRRSVHKNEADYGRQLSAILVK